MSSTQTTPQPAQTLFARILVPIDGSGPSKSAVALAAKLAHATGGIVRIISILESDQIFYGAAAMGYGIDMSSLVDDYRKEARALLDESAKELAEISGVSPQSELYEGNVVSEILRAAKDWQAEVIVMGTHGRTALGRFILGSKAESVLRRSDIPVLVVRGKDEA